MVKTLTPKMVKNCSSSAATGQRRAKLAQTLKGASRKVLKSPTPRKSKRDGRSYAEAVRSGPETGSMSALSKSGAAWKFVKAPKDKKM